MLKNYLNFVLWFIFSIYRFSPLIKFSLNFGPRNFSVVYFNGQWTGAFNMKWMLIFSEVSQKAAWSFIRNFSSDECNLQMNFLTKNFDFSCSLAFSVALLRSHAEIIFRTNYMRDPAGYYRNVFKMTESTEIRTRSEMSFGTGRASIHVSTRSSMASVKSLNPQFILWYTDCVEVPALDVAGLKQREVCCSRFFLD